LAYNPNDYYFKKAKSQNFVARSVFKLEEIDQRFKLIQGTSKILDLGAAPGSWSQFASQKAGPKGRVLGIDLKEIPLTLPNAVFLQADMRQADLGALMTEAGISPPFDLVLSDMAPKTTGVKFTDQMRSLELCEVALEVALKYLKPGGHFVAKLFQSGEFDQYRNQLREAFEKVEVLRPKSTRKESKEVFMIGLKKKQSPTEIN
jgi:23S rRNA (uridine2552-2'-O)-methyltransferase